MHNYFAKNLKYLREQKGVNQEELAKALGVEIAAVSHWENKRREPNMDMVTKIAKYFAVSDDIIFKDLSNESEEEQKYNSLFNKYKQLKEEDKELIKNLIEIQHKKIDEQEQLHENED